MDVYNEILAMYERNYPETLSMTYVVNGKIINIVVAVSKYSL